MIVYINVEGTIHVSFITVEFRMPLELGIQFNNDQTVCEELTF